MTHKKSLSKTGRIIKKETVEVTPSGVNGIQDEAAAVALGGAKVKKTVSKTIRHNGKTTKVKVVHPKAPITFRRNILPPILGILMFIGVLGLLNAQWLVAQYQYRFARPVSTTTYAAQPASIDPKAPAQIIIPAINLTAPVVTDEHSYDQTKVQLALRRGVVQYGSSANPGQKGNMVIIGHSSGVLWTPGNYKFVFTLLDKLKDKDRIFVDYKGTRYIYRVETERVVPPTDLSVLKQTDEPRLTLITCTPVGTSKNRLVITAHQISPNPATATTLSDSQLHPVTTPAIPN